jgi:hypothetical protein
MVVLLLAAALAVDAGRFFSERRYLQNAVDAAALAGAQEWKQALARGETTAQAETSAKARALDALRAPFSNDPTATPPSDPADPPQYDAACGSAPSCLIDGILVNPVSDPGSVRVAMTNDIDFTFGRAAALIGGNLDFQTISARARAGKNPNGIGPLPIAARKYIQPPGPRESTTNPCPAYDPIHPEFTDTFATAATSCLGSTTDSSGRVDPSAASPGLSVEILGTGADPCSSADCGNSPVDFRGFVALDIRNYANATSQQFYNGVTPSTNPQTLKAMQAAYFCSGYPGPPFPDIVTLSPPDPDLQVAALDGSSAGIAVDALQDCYSVGDLILVLVYDGIVKKIPEFDMQWPGNNALGQISVPVIGTGTSKSFSATKNDVFTGSVTLETLPDTNDANNPLLDGTIAASPPISYSPNPVSPSGGNGTTVTIGALTTAPTITKPTGATPGIYSALIKGTANAYSNMTKYLPLSVNVGGITSDFQITGPTPQGCSIAVVAGDTINCDFQVSRVAGRTFPSPVALTLDNLDGSVRQVMGTVNSSNGTASVSISTSGMTQGLYTLVVRGTATDAGGHTITHQYPFVISVAPQSAPGSDTYVDIIGYAVMKITVSEPNSVWASAITPVLTSLDAEELAVVQPIRLIPWDYPTP